MSALTLVVIAFVVGCASSRELGSDTSPQLGSVPGPTAQADAKGVPSTMQAVDPELAKSLQSQLAAREYWASETESGLQAPNRAHDLRIYFDEQGVRIEDRNAPEQTPLVGLTLVRMGRDGALAGVPAGRVVDRGEGRVTIAREQLGLVEWFENRSSGLEQGFTLSERPAPDTESALVFELAVDGARAVRRDDAIQLESAKGRNLDYGQLVVKDAAGEQLAAHFEVPHPDRIRILVDDRGAVYPIVVDPLLTGAFDAVVESNLASSEFGVSVASAGDVDRDGYDDVIVGADLYDQGQNDEGAAFVFRGGPTGIGHGNPGTAHAVLQGDQISGNFGVSVASAGDVNGDGYADVIVGASLFNAGQADEGIAFIYHGSAAGIASGGPAIANGTMESNQTDARLGISVASAGDVNADGYSDVIVGAFLYDAGHTNEGAAFVLLGSSTGIGNRTPATAHARFEGDQADAWLGFSVSDAGDIDADGDSDLIVGAPFIDFLSIDEGVGLVYLGNPAGVASGNPASAHARFYGQNSTRTGTSVAGAGDVNGDGFGDVIVGSPFHTQGQTNEGAAFIFHGGALGFAGGTYLPNNADRLLESNQAESRYGSSVASAGDVNGDGYGDVVVGAYGYDAGQHDEGVAWVYAGSATGIGAEVANLQYDQADAFLGYSVAGIGDVNGDGYDDVVAGAYLANGGQADEGAAFVYHGGALGGFPGAPGSGGGTFFVFGSGIDLSFTSGFYPAPIAAAGDVNGDGFGDVIIGIPEYDGAQVDSGAVFIVHGSQTGLASNPTLFSSSTQIFGDQAGSLFGAWVSAAGDVNGDGYGDVIVASALHDAGEVDEGAAFVFLGSAAGIASGAPGSAHARLETNQANASVNHVATAGDVNGDGYGDVLMSSQFLDSGTADEGAAFVFLGSAAGIANGNPSTAHARFETDQNLARIRASSAGDLNGDGFGDVVFISEGFDSGQTDEGVAFVLLGSTTGISNGNPTTAHARFETNQANAGQNFRSYSPGDVNGDGYADLLVNAPSYSNGETQEGGVFLFNGASSGMVSGNPATANTRIESNQNGGFMSAPYFASPALDVNADGFADLLLGKEASPEFRLYHGSAAGIPNGDLGSANSTLGTVTTGYVPGGDLNGDGHGDLLALDLVNLNPYPFPVVSIGVGSNLSNRGGRPSLARQRRGDGSGVVVSPGGVSSASQFVAELFLRSPRGRAYGKLEIEYCPGTSVVFGAPSCLRQISPSWTDLGTTGAVLQRTIPGLVAGTSYRWRARAHYASYRPTPPGAAIDGIDGPWVRIDGRPMAADIRTPAPEPNAVVALAVGGLLLAQLARGRRSDGRDR